MVNFREMLATLLIVSGLVFGQNNAESKTLKMAANFDSQPFLYMEHDGSIIGFEVDLIREIGKLKGFDVEFVPAIFPHVFDELQEKKIDFIGHVFNDEERKKLYNLTTPHYVDKIEFLTLADKNITDPLAKDMTVSTLAFSPIEEEFQNEIVIDHPTLKMKPELTTFLGFKNLFLKKADVLLTTQSNIDRLTKSYGKHQYQTFALPNKYQQNISISFLTTKENKALADAINAGLQELSRNGTYERLKQKYHL